MACKSGCCGSVAKAPPETSASPAIPAPIQEDKDSCADDSASMIGEDLEKPRTTENPYEELVEKMDDIGGEPPVVQPADNCRPPKPIDNGCRESCCPPPAPPSLDDTPAPSCCVGKLSPCCNQSCLDRIALRECESTDLAGKPLSPSHRPPH
jgi:Cd2+-exporting ATPase